MKDYQKVIAVLLVMVLLVYGGCELGEYRATKRVSTEVVHDSVGVATPYPVPILVRKDSVEYRVKAIHDTVEISGGNTIKYLPIETPLSVADDLNEFNTLRIYDTALNGKRDTAFVSFNVTRNVVTEWRLKLVSHDSTKVVYPPRKFVLSLHPTILGNLTSPVFAYGAGLNFKLPDESAFSLNVLRVQSQPKGQRTMYQVTKDFPIRLKLFPKP